MVGIAAGFTSGLLTRGGAAQPTHHTDSDRVVRQIRQAASEPKNSALLHHPKNTRAAHNNKTSAYTHTLTKPRRPCARSCLARSFAASMAASAAAREGRPS